ncbi:hypothetical protein [Streptomyces sp. cg36]|uniref:hypothetical protein n=1 Tax=Streptomyces sp. cg36 TaxID=3238798 RepID=UPI0034E23B7F
MSVLDFTEREPGIWQAIGCISTYTVTELADGQAHVQTTGYAPWRVHHYTAPSVDAGLAGCRQAEEISLLARVVRVTGPDGRTRVITRPDGGGGDEGHITTGGFVPVGPVS